MTIIQDFLLSVRTSSLVYLEDTLLSPPKNTFHSRRHRCALGRNKMKREHSRDPNSSALWTHVCTAVTVSLDQHIHLARSPIGTTTVRALWIYVRTSDSSSCWASFVGDTPQSVSIVYTEQRVGTRRWCGILVGERSVCAMVRLRAQSPCQCQP